MYHGRDMTQREMAAELGTTRSTVSRWMSYEGVETGYGRHQGVPEDELMADVRRVARELGAVPTMNDYDEHGTWSAWIFWYRFGSWSEARDRAVERVDEDLEPMETEGRSRVELEDGAVAAVADVARELGRPPSRADFREHGPVSPEYVSTRVEGGWRAAKERAAEEAGVDD
jgi:transcriptional regulator with XRE-family HTH domain